MDPHQTFYFPSAFLAGDCVELQPADVQASRRHLIHLLPGEAAARPRCPTFVLAVRMETLNGSTAKFGPLLLLVSVEPWRV